jgi:hypothetical protein
MGTDVTERHSVNKPSSSAKRLADISRGLLGDAFRRQGFASTEILTRWPEIIGADLAAHCEPVKMQWVRLRESDDQEPATLVLRVEGPAAIEIQHLAGVILERVNRFLGWQAVGRIAIRQAPLTRRAPTARRAVDPAAVARISATLDAVEDETLRAALARLGASVKRR